VGGVGAILIEAEGGRRMAGSIIRLLWSNNGKGGGGEATGQGGTWAATGTHAADNYRVHCVAREE
jgi:hypothetical protein